MGRRPRVDRSRKRSGRSCRKESRAGSLGDVPAAWHCTTLLYRWKDEAEAGDFNSGGVRTQCALTVRVIGGYYAATKETAG